MEHLQDIEADINWLAQLIDNRIHDDDFNFESHKPKKFRHDSVYTNFIVNNKVSDAERLLIILAFTPNIYPVFLNERYNLSDFKASRFTPLELINYRSRLAFLKSPSSDSFLPTGHTFLYLIAGENLQQRAYYTKCIFEKRFHAISDNVIFPIQNNNFDPILSNIISISHNYALAFLTNNVKFIKPINNESI